MTKRFIQHIQIVEDTLTGRKFVIDSQNVCGIVTELLNEQHETIQELKLQLNLCSDQKSEFYRGARENANRVGKLKKENKQLKDEVYDWKTSAEDYLKLGKSLKKENEQLKSELHGMEELLKSYRKTIKHDAELLADATKNGYLPPLEELER